MFGGIRARSLRTKPMNMTAINHQMHWKPAAGVEPTVRTDGAGLKFDFARTRRMKLPGPAQYLILVRRRYADRAKVSWAFRGMTN